MEDQHFYKKLEDGRFQFCVGVPESFSKMEKSKEHRYLQGGVRWQGAIELKIGK